MNFKLYLVEDRLSHIEKVKKWLDVCKGKFTDPEHRLFKVNQNINPNNKYSFENINITYIKPQKDKPKYDATDYHFYVMDDLENIINLVSRDEDNTRKILLLDAILQQENAYNDIPDELTKSIVKELEKKNQANRIWILTTIDNFGSCVGKYIGKESEEKFKNRYSFKFSLNDCFDDYIAAIMFNYFFNDEVVELSLNKDSKCQKLFD